MTKTKDIDKEKVLAYLKKHHSITDLEAREYIGTTRLGARIWDLRHDEDIDIVTFSVSVNIRADRTSKIAKYMLWEDVANLISPAGVIKTLEDVGYKKVDDAKAGGYFVRYSRLEVTRDGKLIRYKVNVPTDPTNPTFKTSLRQCVNIMLTDSKLGTAEGRLISTIIANSAALKIKKGKKARKK